MKMSISWNEWWAWKKNLNQNEKWMFAVGASRLCERVRNFLLNIKIFFVRSPVFVLYFVYFMWIHNYTQKIPLIYCFSVEEIPVAGRVCLFFFSFVAFLGIAVAVAGFDLCVSHTFFILFFFHFELLDIIAPIGSKRALKHPHMLS